MAGSATTAEVSLKVDDKASAPLKAAGAAAGDAADETGRLADAQDRVGDAAGKGSRNLKASIPDIKDIGTFSEVAGSSSAKLAGALSLLGDGAGDAARDLADLADVGELASAAATGLGISTGPLAALIAGVAVEVALAAGIYKGWNDEAELAARLAADVGAANEKLQPILADTAAATIDLRVAMGDLTESQGEKLRQGVTSLQAWSDATEDTRKRLGELRTESASMSTQLVDMADAIIPSWTPLGLALDGLTTSSAEYGEEISALEGQLSGSIQVLAENVQVHNKLTDAQEKGATAAERQAAAITRAKTALEAFLAETGTGKGYVDQLRAALEGMVPPEAIPAAEKLATQEDEITSLYEQGVITAEDYARAIDLVAAAKNRLARATEEEMDAAKEAAAATGSDMGAAFSGAASAQAGPDVAGMANAVSGVAGAAQSGLGGLPGVVSSLSDMAGVAGMAGTSAGLAAAGPIVAAIVAIISLVTALVPEEGAAGLMDQVHGTIMEFLGDIGQLPDVLSETLANSISEGIPALFDVIPELIESVISEIPEILVSITKLVPMVIGELLEMLFSEVPNAIFEGLQELFSPEVWGDLLKELAEAIIEAFDGLGKKKKDQAAGDDAGFWDRLFVTKKEKAAGQRSSLDELFFPDQEPVGTFATGTDLVTRSGLAKVHQGERIIPADGASSGRSAQLMAGGGGDTHIHLPPGLLVGTVDQLVRELNRHLGANGRLGWAQ